MHAALDDLRVIDISTSPSGAWCSRLLSGFGAGVVMVETRGGHPARRLAPFDAQGASIPAAYWLAGKQSVHLEIEDPDERACLLDLIRSADVLISGRTPSDLARLSLTYDAIAAPGLIMAHLTPFGASGDLAERPGNDLAVAARSGWASINGVASREPLKPSGWQASYCAGLGGFLGILAALHHRDRGGRGQELDISETGVMLAAFAPAFLRAQYTGEALKRKDAADLLAGPVPVADGHFALTISRAHFWRDAMNLLGLPDLAEDPRWEAGWYRAAHKDEYVERVQEKMRGWPKARLFEELASRRVVAGPVLTMAELVDNPHLAARGFWVTPPGTTGPVEPGAPVKLSATPWRPPLPAPAPGQNTHQVLQADREAPAPVQGTCPAPAGPLSGLRGIVLTQAWAGTFCTELLGLIGADVVQVEVRKRPDSWRGSYDAPLPAALADLPTAQHPWNCNPLYNSVNLNKRCVTIDMQVPGGRELFLRLLPHADFVAENFSPRVLGNLGIGYDTMRAINPGVILCSLSAYGHDGPWANIPGIGGTIEPTSGMSALLGYEDGPPLNSGQMYPDAVAGFYGAAAILAALHHRERTGQGQYIDLSMQEANLTFAGDAALEYTLTGRQRPRMGNRHTTFAPHGIYPCAGEDRWLAIACETEAQWRALCRETGATGWASDPRFGDNARRKTNEGDLDNAIAAWTRSFDRDSLADRLSCAGVIAAPVLDALEVAADPLPRERGTIVEVDHPEAGCLPQVALPFRFSVTPPGPVRPAPMLGEHSFKVFAELLGMNRAEYDTLVAAGISGIGPPTDHVEEVP